MVRAKIICTLGPASDNSGVLSKMVRSGMDVARLNFSHGSLDEHREKIRHIRTINHKYRRHIKILGDLEGYRIRIGRLHQPMEVKKGQPIWLTTEEIVGRKNVIPFDYEGPLTPLRGKDIFIDDGNIHLVVESAHQKEVKTKVVVGGVIKEHKGMNIPDVRLSFSGLTGRDKTNIEFCLENNIDYLAQSFVRNRKDILDLRTYLNGRDRNLKIFAKIENREGIKNIDQIIKICDGIMVARGDMGVSIPIYEVPIVQKAIIKKCNRARKLVITATQMLESMTEHYRPTRAEVSDVANAILDGTDFVMLSGETAIGAYPVETVAMMDKIIQFTLKASQAHRSSL